MASGNLQSGTWKYVDTKTGTSGIALPSDFTELQVEVQITANRLAAFHLIRNELTSSEKRFIAGTYFATGDNNGCSIGCTTGRVAILYAFSNGTDKTSTATITVYYK